MTEERRMARCLSLRYVRAELDPRRQPASLTPPGPFRWPVRSFSDFSRSTAAPAASRAETHTPHPLLPPPPPTPPPPRPLPPTPPPAPPRSGPTPPRPARHARTGGARVVGP